MTSTINGASPSVPSVKERLLFLDALRAFASVLIVWHHFALYPPLSVQAEPIAGRLVFWLADYARSTQVFFVIGGYVMARGMSRKQWNRKTVGQFIVQRYCRLGLPYLGAIVLAMIANEFGRGWLPDKVVGSPPELRQVLAHLFFMQEFLGYEHLSAGLWFICINFQLGLIYVATLWFRDSVAGWLKVPATTNWIDVPLLAGWSLAMVSLFHFNRHAVWDSWAVYFFPYFFMGIVLHRAMTTPGVSWMFWSYQLAIIAAMVYDWRWRLASAVIVGLVLFAAEKSGISTRWPRNRWVAALGMTSYSLFLVHFPVLVIVSTTWTRFGWTSAPAAVAGLLVAFSASVAVAFAFYRFVERPAGALTRRGKVAA